MPVIFNSALREQVAKAARWHAYCPAVPLHAAPRVSPAKLRGLALPLWCGHSDAGCWTQPKSSPRAVPLSALIPPVSSDTIHGHLKPPRQRRRGSAIGTTARNQPGLIARRIDPCPRCKSESREGRSLGLLKSKGMVTILHLSSNVGHRCAAEYRGGVPEQNRGEKFPSVSSEYITSAGISKWPIQISSISFTTLRQRTS